MQPPSRIGPFRVLDKLGQGGMGVVYRVQDPRTPRLLALKLILGHRAGRVALERFRREADTLARVNHRHVVKIHTIGQSPHGMYLVQELVEGQNLAEMCDLQPLEAKRAARLLLGLADAVSAVHAQGILHRDLKPANVMVRPSGEPVLLDFGLARDENAETLTRTGCMVGTPAYMAPEQVRGRGPETLGPATDVYGLGTILYQALTGEAPFQGAAVHMLGQILHAPAPSPRASRLDVPPDLAAICVKAMAKAPDDRYPTAAALGEDLRHYVRGEPTRALRERGVRRGALLATVGSALAVAGGVGLAWALLQSSSPEPPASPTPLAPASVAPVDEDPPPPATTGSLWRLAAGETFRSTFDYAEETSQYTLELSIDVDVTVAEAAGGVHRLDLRLAALRAVYGVNLQPRGLKLDSAADDAADAELHPLRQAVGMTFSVQLDPETGRIFAVTGLEAIRRAVASDEFEWGLMSLWTFEQLRDRFFSDAFFEANLNAVSHVRDGVLRWRPDAVRGFRLRHSEREARLPTVISVLDPTGVMIRGETRFANGCLSRGQVRQSLSGDADDDEVSTSWTLRVHEDGG